MLVCRSLFRVNLLVRRTTYTCGQSKPLFYFQKHKFFHGFSCDLMDARKRIVDIGPKWQKNVTQTWRAVSTQPNCYEGDGKRDKLKSQLEEMHHAISSSVLAPEAESSNPEVLSEPIGSDTCPATEGSKDDISLDEKLVPPEKHSVSMEVGQFVMRVMKRKGKSDATQYRNQNAKTRCDAFKNTAQEEIEAETGVKIIFPSSETEDFITIEGNSAESVTKASEKIQNFIDKAVNSRDIDYSHFVSLPLAIHPGLVDKLVNFQNTILEIAASDKDKNVESDTDGGTSDEKEDQQSPKACKVVVELEAEKDDACVKVNVMSDDQHSTKAPLVTELKAEGATNTFNKGKITNIPLVSYRPKESKTHASESSSSKSTESQIMKSMFIKPKTFHLTVLMLKLWNKDRVQVAAEVLQSVSSKVMDALEHKPVLVRLKGLDCMRGSLDKARVLYVPVEEIGDEGRLLCACQVITDAFVEAGLVIERDVQQKLKLHATIMNARSRNRKNKARKLDSFDARGILDLYGSEEWGEYPIREAHLSQRFALDENGYYHCCASFPFPDEMQVD